MAQALKGVSVALANQEFIAGFVDTGRELAGLVDKHRWYPLFCSVRHLNILLEFPLHSLREGRSSEDLLCR